MGTECVKRIIIELYENGSYNALGNKDTKDACGYFDLDELLSNVKEQMSSQEIKNGN